jgi:Tol biopolymer transport system component
VRIVAGSLSLLLLALVACGGAEIDEIPSGAARSPAVTADVDLGSGWIVYQGILDGAVNLGLIRPDGAEDHPIPNAPDDNRLHPDWSPDGRWLTFDSNDPETDVAQIYVMRADGSKQRLLLSCEAPCYGNGGPVWAPGGGTIFFDAAEGPTDEHGGDLCYLAKVAVGSGEIERFLQHPGCRVADSYVRVSPDGAHVVFDRTAGDRQAVFTATVDGSEERRITPWGVGQRPVWSPDGEWIVLMSGPECEDCGSAQPSISIELVRPDGSDLRTLTDPANDERDVYPSWLPDGSGVLFSRCSGRFTCEVRLASLDGTDRMVLPASDRGIVHPILQPTS